MSDSLSVTMRRHAPFAHWLRTGFWLAEPALEVKFNPNHDPSNGQFTFASGGGEGASTANYSTPPPRIRKDGSGADGDFHGGGGGSSGGGGATGSWDDGTTAASRASGHTIVRTGQTADRGLAVGGPAPHGTVNVSKNGYQFNVDTSDRTTRVNGNLTLENAARSRASQNQAGGTDRRETDDGGHFVAARFNGPGESFNHFAQDASFNRGAYRTLENGWAKDLRAGKDVSVDITAHYPGMSRRPDSLIVNWSVDGQQRSRRFKNAPRGK